MKKILVTGANGQLGKCLNAISKKHETMALVFMDSKDLDITNLVSVNKAFLESKYDYCINCAAYTAVDKAEEQEESAARVNEQGARNLALACKQSQTTLFHISTDFVFDGESNHPYNENDKTNPVSVYGRTKLNGEKEIVSILTKYYIIRTSWLYSEFGNNFVKTMLKLGSERDKLTIISDQIGTPTYAMDLANAIMTLITSEKPSYGIYNYSNEGTASWYDFAKAIFDIKKMNLSLEPIPTKNYPTPAKRPLYSILNKEKIKNNFSMAIPYWRTSLENCLRQL
ncbi:dTDP-4-dehydrorhamnose reductase [Lacinutrix sp.]|uniref:dTDP-4-dehydrorhamnose reductase n=1 Tax=Lacinutrix sp. TaxID=1937692 RepID=UPI002602799E|nr:dTDP-4-dehydrorhamnose reductase [Lacinutrix sp.]MDG1715032.1 dTDP-4-dehydrorhamnose reductase [Lacinutrix sp.]